MILSAVLVAGGTARAQANDDCANATPISGLSQWGFDNSAATTDGPFDCLGIPVRRDLWWVWTAPSTGSFQISTCGQTSVGTRIVVYDGVGCPPTDVIGCENSSCSGQTRMWFQATQGQQYTVRLGSRMANDNGSGTFEILDGTVCSGIPDDPMEDQDTCDDAMPLIDGSYSNLHVSKDDSDWFALEVANGDTLTVAASFLHGNGDINLRLQDVCGGTQVAGGGSNSDNELFMHTNNTGCSQTYLLQVELAPFDGQHDCNDYDLAIQGTTPGGSCSIGTIYCNPAANNSTGSPAAIAAGGSTAANDNDLTLTADGMPANQLGYFLCGMGQNTFTPPGAGGAFCIGGGGLGRFFPPGLTTGANGTYSFTLDLNAVPRFGSIMAGDTMNFQAWYQDGSTSNFSDALEVTFN